MTPIEILGAAFVVMVLGSTIATTSDEDSEADVWYCFICAGTSSERHIDHVEDPNDARD